jgi:hypothetical protein
VYLVLVAGVFLSFIAYPGPVFDQRTYELVGVACAVVSLGFAIRGAALGIEVGSEKVLVRSWFRTRRLARVEIVEVSSVIYDGWRSGRRPSATTDTLQLRLRNGRSVTAWGIVGSRATVRKRVVRLRVCLGLLQQNTEPPRRRARERRSRRPS